MTMPHALLIATGDDAVREFLAAQLDADGHTVQTADTPQATTAKLSTSAIDVMVLGDFQSPGEGPALLRALRSGALHTRVHPDQPVVTIGDASEPATVRAYEAGSDHHLPADSTYLVTRAVLGAVLRRSLEERPRRHLHVGPLHIDVLARSADVNGTPVALSKREFEVLCVLARDPGRVIAKEELMLALWGQAAGTRTRTVESHVCRLRTKLVDGGADGFVANSWGVGWKLTAGPTPDR